MCVMIKTLFKVLFNYRFYLIINLNFDMFRQNKVSYVLKNNKSMVSGKLIIHVFLFYNRISMMIFIVYYNSIIMC